MSDGILTWPENAQTPPNDQELKLPGGRHGLSAAHRRKDAEKVGANPSNRNAKQTMEINFTLLGATGDQEAVYSSRTRNWGPEEYCDDVRTVLRSAGMTNVSESDWENMLTVTEAEFDWELYITVDRPQGSQVRFTLTAVSADWCASPKRVDQVAKALARAALLLTLARPATIVTAPVPRWY